MKGTAMTVLSIHTRYSFDELSDRYADGDITFTFRQTGEMLAASECDEVNIFESEKFGGKYWGKGTVVEVDSTIGKVYVDMD